MSDLRKQINRLGHHHFLAMMTGKIIYAILLLAFLPACKPDSINIAASGFPEDIAPIFLNSCASSGCHTAQSAPGAAGLNLESWESLFEGSRGGSPVIPFSPNQSYLLYSVNTDTTLGLTLTPTMPYNEDPLTSEEYALLWNWIFDGAPNANGEVRFPPQSNRKKWYVGHQICDEVAVFDAESRQIMRYVDVGLDPLLIEYVFDIKISPDGKDWYVVYFGGNEHISRFSTETDEKVADISMGSYAWSTLDFSPDGTFAFVCSEYLSQLQVVDLERNVTAGPLLNFGTETRGPMVHPTRQQVYLTQYQASGLTVLDYDEAGQLHNQRSIDLIQGSNPDIAGDLWPFDLQFLPDGSKYFVSCTHSKEIRVMDGQTDTLLQAIRLPSTPSKMDYSTSTGRLFVSCMEDKVSWPGDHTKRGSIMVINAESHQLEATLYSGFQPYSIFADDANGVLVVSNRNSDLSGPQPHHVSECAGRNGYISLIDLQSLEVVPDFKPEVLADPSTLAGM